MARTFSTGFLLGATLSAGIALGAGGVFYATSTTENAPTSNDQVEPSSDDAVSSKDDGELLDETIEQEEKVEAERITGEIPDDFEPKTFEVVIQGEPDSLEDDPMEGESLSDAIRRLEASYRDLLAQQEELFDSQLRADEQRLAEATYDEEAEARVAPSVGDSGADPAPASDHDQYDDYQDAPGERVVPVTTQNNYYAVSQVTPVYVIHHHDHDEGRGREEKRNKRVSRYDDLGLQRAILQPMSSTSSFLGMRANSPWSPIDMSGHQNPWAVTPMP